MPKLIKILYIDSEFKTIYFIYRPGSSIRTTVPLATAIKLLKNEEFDLIVSEPHNKAILRDNPFRQPGTGSLKDNPPREAHHGRVG